MSEIKTNLAARKKIKIVIVDDHVSVRQGFVQLLKDVENFKVVGEASNGKEALEILKELSPDILLLDLEMPQMNGKEVLQKIIKGYPQIKPIILSGHYGNLFVKELVNSGARAYISKSSDVDVIIDTINQVYQMGYCVSQSITEQVISGHFQQLKLNDFDQMALTQKEGQVLKLMCDGLPTKQMADILKVDINTINYHKRNIYRKTSLKSVAPLVKYAIKNGYTDL